MLPGTSGMLQHTVEALKRWQKGLPELQTAQLLKKAWRSCPEDLVLSC